MTNSFVKFQKELSTKEKQYTKPKNDKVNTISKKHNCMVYKFKEIAEGSPFFCALIKEGLDNLYSGCKDLTGFWFLF